MSAPARPSCSPHYIDGTLAFMFETRLPVRPTRFALETKILQHEYYECWQSLKKNFLRRWIIEARAFAGGSTRSERQLTDRFSKAEWKRTSWVESANDTACGFPLQSLPYCIFAGTKMPPRPGVGIGSFVLDLQACSGASLFAGLPAVYSCCLRGSHAESVDGLRNCRAFRPA